MVVFSKATVPDILTIQELANKIWFSHYPGIITINQIDYMLRTMYATEVIKLDMEKWYFWDLIIKDEQPIGFISCSLEFNFNGNYLKLNKLYLLPSCHGQGIGQHSLDFVKERAKMLNVTNLYIAVNKANTKAISAYKKSGFTLEREVVTEIGDGFVMDDFIMTVSI